MALANQTSLPIVVAGGVSPYSFQIVNDSDTTISATIVGSSLKVDATAKAPGPYQVKVRVTDSAAPPEVSYQIVPVQVVDSASFVIKEVSFSVVSDQYPAIRTFQLSAYGGHGTLAWEILPSSTLQEVSIDQNGLVTSVINQQGNYTLSVRATDSVGNVASSSIGVSVVQSKPYRMVDGSLEIELSAPSVAGPRSVTATLTDALNNSLTRTFNFSVSESQGDLRVKPYTINHYFAKNDQGQFVIPVVGDFQGLSIDNVNLPAVLGMPVSLNETTKTFTIQGPPTMFGNGEVDLAFNLTRAGETVATFKKTISVDSYDGTSQSSLGTNHITMRPLMVGEVVGLNPQKPWFNSPQASRSSGWKARVASGSALPPGLSLDQTTGLLYGPILNSFTQPSLIEFYDASGVCATFEITWDILKSDFNILESVEPLHLGRTPVGSFLCQCDSPIVNVDTHRGSLPAGLTLVVNEYNKTKVDLVGPPSTIGFFDVWLRLTNADGEHGYVYKRLEVRFSEPLGVSTSSLASATKGVSYSKTLSALGGLPPYKWSLATAVSTNKWVSGPTLGGLSTNKVSSRSVTLTNGTIWIGPGYDSVVGAYDDCQIFDPATGSFFSATDTPVAVGRYAAAPLSAGRVLLIGGFGVSNKCYIYDSATKVWSVAADLPASRMDLAASTLADGSVLACGGSDGSVARSEVYKYNPTNNTWSIMTAMPAGLVDTCQATLTDNNVLVVGINSLSQAKAYLYTTGTGLWSTLTSPSLDRCQGSSLVPLSGSRALLIGGWGVVPVLTARRETLYFDGSVWTSGPSLPTGLADASAQLIGNKVMSFGGRNEPGVRILQSFVLDTAAVIGVDSPALPTGMTLSSIGVLSGTPTNTSYNQNVVFMVSDAAGTAATKAVNLRVTSTLAVTTTIIPAVRSAEGYSFALSASGGQPPYTWSMSGGSLPSGLTLSSAGVISGQHLDYDAWESNPIFKVTDSLAAQATQPIHVFINNSAGLNIDSSSVPTIKRGCGYSATLKVIDGVAPFKWTLKGGSLPSGLSLSEDGLSQGSVTTITGATTETFSNQAPVVMVVDSTGAFGTKQMSLTSTPSLTFLDSTLPQGRVGVAYTHALTAKTCATPMTFALEASSLPSGLTLSPEGVISGTPGQSGITPVSIKVTDGAGDVLIKQFSVIISATALSISSTTLPGAVLGKAYSYQLTQSGGLAPYKWSIDSGNLPANFNLDRSSGILSCPSVGANQIGTYNLRLKVEDSDFTNGGSLPYSAFKDFVLSISSSVVILSGPDKTLGLTTGLLGVRWLGPLSGLQTDLVKRDSNSFRIFVQGWPSTTDVPTLTCSDPTLSCLLADKSISDGSLNLTFNVRIDPAYVPTEQVTKKYNFTLKGTIGVTASASFGIAYKMPPVLSLIDGSGKVVFNN